MDETTSNKLMDTEGVLLCTRLEVHRLSHSIARNQFPLPLHLSNGKTPRWYRDEIDNRLHDPQRARAK